MTSSGSLWRDKESALFPMETQRARFVPFGDMKTLLFPMETQRACLVPNGGTKSLFCSLPMETLR